MKKALHLSADLERPGTWIKFRSTLCDSCRASCCTMPAEVRIADLVRMGVVDPFEAEEPLRLIARRLIKAGLIDHFNHKSERFTLARRANGDCIYLDGTTRGCTIYENYCPEHGCLRQQGDRRRCRAGRQRGKQSDNRIEKERVRGQPGPLQIRDHQGR